MNLLHSLISSITALEDRDTLYALRYTITATYLKVSSNSSNAACYMFMVHRWRWHYVRIQTPTTTITSHYKTRQMHLNPGNIHHFYGLSWKFWSGKKIGLGDQNLWNNGPGRPFSFLKILVPL